MTREERISAYLDGELDDEAARDFERDLEADPELQRELERLTANDDLLRTAFRQAVPDAADPAAAERFGLGPKPSAERPANDNRPLRWAVGGALAASVALLLVLRPFGGGEADPLSRALDATPSLQTASLDQGRSLTPVLTFAAADGRYCREYRLQVSGRSSEAIACRNADKWQVVAESKASEPLADPSRIEVASGAAEGAIDAAYARLGGSEPLDSAEEHRLIADGWAAKKKQRPAE